MDTLNYADAHNNRGVSLYKAFQLDRDFKNLIEAEKEFREAIKINPDYAEAHFNLGNLLVHSFRPKGIPTNYLQYKGKEINTIYDSTRFDTGKKEIAISIELCKKQGDTQKAEMYETILKNICIISGRPPLLINPPIKFIIILGIGGGLLSGLLEIFFSVFGLFGTWIMIYYWLFIEGDIVGVSFRRKVIMVVIMVAVGSITAFYN